LLDQDIVVGFAVVERKAVPKPGAAAAVDNDSQHHFGIAFLAHQKGHPFHGAIG